MRASNRFRSLSVLAIVAAAAGCTLANSFDEVKQPTETDYVPGTASARVDPDGGAAAPEDAGADADVATAKDVVVVGGEVANDAGGRTGVLAVLDTATGAQVGSYETMHVAGVAHDAARDLWYVFEAPNHFVPTPSDVVKLHLRKLDRTTGAWTELSSIEVPPIAFYNGLGVTTERLTYIAYDADGGIPVGSRMVTVSTTNTAAPLVIDNQIISPTPSNILAVPSTSGAGGQLTLVNTGRSADGDCPGYPAQQCSAKIRRFLVPNGGVPTPFGAPITLGMMAAFGLPAGAIATCGGDPDEVVVTPAGVDGGWKVHTLGYQSTTEVERTQFTMNTSASLLRAGAFDDMRRVIFLVEANTDTNLYAVPLDNGNVVKAPLLHSGQAVYYDTASQTVFAPFNQGDNFTFSAFRVSGAADGVQLKKRDTATDWNPPADLRPILLGIRHPATIDCP